MIRVVLDTNVLISALLQPEGLPAQVLLLTISGSSARLRAVRVVRWRIPVRAVVRAVPAIGVRPGHFALSMALAAEQERRVAAGYAGA